MTFTSTISTASGWTFPSSSQDIIRSRYSRNKTIFHKYRTRDLPRRVLRILTSERIPRWDFFRFQVAVNPEFKVGEMSFDNNAAICRLLYTETFATVHSCIMGRPWHNAHTIAGIFLDRDNLQGERFMSDVLAWTGHNEQDAIYCV